MRGAAGISFTYFELGRIFLCLVISVSGVACDPLQTRSPGSFKISSSRQSVSEPTDPVGSQISSCRQGTSLYQGLCYAAAQTCAIQDGAGTQTFSNGAYGTCLVSSCHAGFHASNN